MEIKFDKVSDFKQGIFFDLLIDAYSFDDKYINVNKEKWCDDDTFFLRELKYR